MCVSVIKIYWTCFCAGVQHACVSLTVMCFVPDLWPVWRGGRCHSMTWKRYSLSPLHHPLPLLSNFSPHILLWVELEFYAMALMTGRLEQDGNKATIYWNPERLNILKKKKPRETHKTTQCVFCMISCCSSRFVTPHCDITATPLFLFSGSCLPCIFYPSSPLH